MSKKLILDRNRQEILVGMTVRVCHCTGRYGKTTTDEGVVKKIDQYCGVTLELLKPTKWESKDGVKHLKVGDTLYIPLPGFWDFHAKAHVCDKVHTDFEHGHHAWAEVIAATCKECGVDLVNRNHWEGLCYDCALEAGLVDDHVPGERKRA